ncbi:MAG: hypothetical protein COU69_01215 [Candidatus Pacebacteria bacterium CG10_big_fil_rev_8_21_14_0_10_56_10]|nr:MAG: hypothetical protein COU69_01215 [Candidatus Pacebacteria bacterium CG10_big_fil_rev_8_21_14_0_10_56_10]
MFITVTQQLIAIAIANFIPALLGRYQFSVSGNDSNYLTFALLIFTFLSRLRASQVWSLKMFFFSWQFGNGIIFGTSKKLTLSVCAKTAH